MRILVNATSCVAGGGIQTTVAFIRQTLRNPMGHEFYFAVSAEIMPNVGALLRDAPFKFGATSVRPSRFFRGAYSRRRLRVIEGNFHPDVVFTIFGPAYVKFRAPHLCGFADPWVTHATPLVYGILSRAERIKTHLVCKYKVLHLSRSAYYWVESVVARQGLAKKVGISGDRIKIIPNTYSDIFKSYSTSKECMSDFQKIILSVAHPYPHKNLTIIPEVAAILRDHMRRNGYQFVVTLPENGKEVDRFWKKSRSLGVEGMIINAGVLKLEDCPLWYERAHLVFLPTLLETFSATYPEAMMMGRPIVTTDLDFAHAICGDAAEYYQPLSAASAAKAILHVAEDRLLRTRLVENGYRRVKELPTAEEKYQMQMAAICEVASTASRQPG